MTAFDSDTAVQRIDALRFTGRIDPKWWVFRGPNGGYVAAILQRAMAEAVDDSGRPARSLTVHFLVPPETGEVELARKTAGPRVPNLQQATLAVR